MSTNLDDISILDRFITRFIFRCYGPRLQSANFVQHVRGSLARTGPRMCLASSPEVAVAADPPVTFVVRAVLNSNFGATSDESVNAVYMSRKLHLDNPSDTGTASLVPLGCLVLDTSEADTRIMKPNNSSKDPVVYSAGKIPPLHYGSAPARSPPGRRWTGNCLVHL